MTRTEIEKTNESTQEEMQKSAEKFLNNSTYGAFGKTDSDSADYDSLLNQLNNL